MRFETLRNSSNWSSVAEARSSLDGISSMISVMRSWMLIGVLIASRIRGECGDKLIGILPGQADLILHVGAHLVRARQPSLERHGREVLALGRPQGCDSDRIAQSIAGLR